jgi:hypothetical protein
VSFLMSGQVRLVKMVKMVLGLGWVGLGWGLG